MEDQRKHLLPLAIYRGVGKHAIFILIEGSYRGIGWDLFLFPLIFHLEESNLALAFFFLFFFFFVISFLVESICRCWCCYCFAA